MPIDLMALEPQKISKNLRGKYIMIYGQPRQLGLLIPSSRKTK